MYQDSLCLAVSFSLSGKAIPHTEWLNADRWSVEYMSSGIVVRVVKFVTVYLALSCSVSFKGCP